LVSGCNMWYTRNSNFLIYPDQFQTFIRYPISSNSASLIPRPYCVLSLFRKLLTIWHYATVCLFSHFICTQTQYTKTVSLSCCCLSLPPECKLWKSTN
jgi:hypothetical protein